MRKEILKNENLKTINNYWQLKAKEYYRLEIDLPKSQNPKVTLAPDPRYFTLDKEITDEKFEAIFMVKHKEFFTHTGDFILHIEDKNQMRLVKVPYQIRTSTKAKFFSAALVILTFTAENILDFLNFIAEKAVNLIMHLFIDDTKKWTNLNALMSKVLCILILYIVSIMILYIYDWWNGRT